MRHPRLSLAIISAGLLASSLSALPSAGAETATGTVSSIALRDFNQDGKIDRAVISFANPAKASWAVGGLSGFSVAYDGKPVTVSDAFMASKAADPAVLEVVFDASDPDLPIDTSADKIEVAYTRPGLAGGVSDGASELAAIASGDTGAGDTEADQAAPVLVSSTPEAGYDEYKRTSDLTFVFSEPIASNSVVLSSAMNPGGWILTAVGRSLIAQHSPYLYGAMETIGVSAKDLSGNPLALDAYPNPFSFNIERTSDPLPHANQVFALTSPTSGMTLPAGQAAVLAWYSTMSGLSTVRLSYSADAGQTWTAIASVPAAQKSTIWYPPTLAGAIQLKAEGLDASGAFVNLSIVGTITVSGAASTSPMRAVSSVSITQPTDTTATAVVKLDRTPTSASLTCMQGLPSITLLTKGDRPATVEASLMNLIAGSSYNCTFHLRDAAGTALDLSVPAFVGGTDTAAPQIVGSAVVDQFDAAAGTARLSWTTDEASTASVNYGLYLNYGSSVEDKTLAAAHSVMLAGLQPGKMHQARITSLDAKGNGAASKDWYFVFLKENDLIKGSGAAVYWYKGGKRYAFPNYDTYASWFGGDFSKVIKVPDTQLGTIALGGNIKMKEGVYLLKIQSDPKTYAVEPNGALRWIQTEAQAKALYGTAWAKRVRDVDVSLWVDYAIGSPLGDGEKPAGYNG